jgi:muconolactone delta-isomerase
MTTAQEQPTDFKATAEQKEAVQADHAEHRRWLAQHGIVEALWPMGEVNYTGLVLAAMLDPDAGDCVLGALLAGLPPRPAATLVPAASYAPSRGVDLVVPMECNGAAELLIAEFKRFGSPSHAPGYKTDPQAAWQTDQAYEAATGIRPAPRWLYDDLVDHQRKTFLVVDTYGRPMDQTFFDGAHNAEWGVTSYAQFGAVLRAGHERGTRGLVPLLRALYAG